MIDVRQSPVAEVLDILLEDKTTKRGIIWATDSYQAMGEGFHDKNSITKECLLLHGDLIQPRIEKDARIQAARTRRKAEVFTPAWLCNLMNNEADALWFERCHVFNREREDGTWTATAEKIAFSEEGEWKRYVDSRRLEITCGEAPFLVSPYDTSTGFLIEPLQGRVGILDRKLRVVDENTTDEGEWVEWALRGVEACYGYEYQGDNLLIARINVLTTFVDYFRARWRREPELKLLRKVANRIAWNLWQMDGLKDTIPLGKPYESFRQLSIFDEKEKIESEEYEALPAKIFNWRRGRSLAFNACKGDEKVGKKLFDFIIGNPPYNEELEATSDKPVYNYLMDAAFACGQVVELITPARFLFNGGKTPKAWNKKMLADPFLKVLYFEQKSSKVFGDTDIKGGIAITIRNANFRSGPIEVFSPFEELRSIRLKVSPHVSDSALPDIIFLQNRLNLENLYKDHPEAIENIGSKGKEKRIVTSAFNQLEVFTEEKVEEESVQIQGLVQPGNRRITKWIPRRYVEDNGNLETFKVMLPKSNGSGAIGEVLSTPLIGEPLIGEPLIGYTQSFIGIGSFERKEEASNAMKYIKTKFARTLLGVLKITQDNPPEKWKYVPLQDFTSSSDIDWSKSIPEIDRQLYVKYGLDADEIHFIETRVKEME